MVAKRSKVQVTIMVKHYQQNETFYVVSYGHLRLRSRDKTLTGCTSIMRNIVTPIRSG